MAKNTGGKKGFITEEQMQEALSTLYGKAMNGVPAVSRSIDELAADYEKKHPGDTKAAAKALAKNQIAKCGTSGFLTGLGGVITIPVALPANITSVLYVQLRMIAAIAKLGGYDIHSDQVQTLVYSCLVKGALADTVKSTGIKIGEQVAINAIKSIPGSTIAKINQKVGFSLVTLFGYSSFGKNAIVNISKMVPVVGGFIGGGFDTVTTRMIAKRAITFFIDGQIPKE